MYGSIGITVHEFCAKTKQNKKRKKLTNVTLNPASINQNPTPSNPPTPASAASLALTLLEFNMQDEAQYGTMTPDQAKDIMDTINSLMSGKNLPANVQEFINARFTDMMNQLAISPASTNYTYIANQMNSVYSGTAPADLQCVQDINTDFNQMLAVLKLV